MYPVAKLIKKYDLGNQVLSEKLCTVFAFSTGWKLNSEKKLKNLFLFCNSEQRTRIEQGCLFLPSSSMEVL
jgi:hypothetical protein